MGIIVAGCDIGSITGKTVIIEEGKIIASSIVPSTPLPVKTANDTINKALENIDLRFEDVKYVVGTGYGRVKIPFANKTLTEIACHARGAAKLNKNIKTLIDIGGQDTKVIALDEKGKGKVKSFVMNDKCAAGTGRFLEVMARVFGIESKEIGPLTLKAQKIIPISSQCSVFAESEIISLVAEENDICEILAGICDSVAGRIESLVGRVGLREFVTVSGGVGKNIGVCKALERRLGVKIKKMPGDPQLVGALGAALIAEEMYIKQNY
jgi:predicted CoA-substrate-specific enzyme activase